MSRRFACCTLFAVSLVSQLTERACADQFVSFRPCRVSPMRGRYYAVCTRGPVRPSVEVLLVESEARSGQPLPAILDDSGGRKRQVRPIICRDVFVRPDDYVCRRLTLAAPPEWVMVSAKCCGAAFVGIRNQPAKLMKEKHCVVLCFDQKKPPVYIKLTDIYSAKEIAEGTTGSGRFLAFPSVTWLDETNERVLLLEPSATPDTAKEHAVGICIDWHTGAVTPCTPARVIESLSPRYPDSLSDAMAAAVQIDAPGWKERLEAVLAEEDCPMGIRTQAAFYLARVGNEKALAHLEAMRCTLIGSDAEEARLREDLDRLEILMATSEIGFDERSDRLLAIAFVLRWRSGE